MPARKPVASQVATEPPPASAPQPVPVPALDAAASHRDPVPAHETGHAGDCPGEQTAARLPSSRRHSRKSSLAGNPFTLTLIRRDPGSGSQWNVGRVSSRQLETPSAEDESAVPQTHSSVSPSPPIDVEIETSGYAKFRRRPVRQSAKGGLEAVLAAAAEESVKPRSDIGVFSTRVSMGYSKNLTANTKETIGRLKQAGRGRISHGRNGSITSIDPAVYNPLVAEQGPGVFKTGSPTVSELRFSLPTSELLGDKAKVAKDQWRGSFGKLLLRPGHDHGDGDAVSPFEVNVGAERAGGGMRGREAKLGKLIIYDDGLKMLDLLVAVNMGVWWGAWERTF